MDTTGSFLSFDLTTGDARLIPAMDIANEIKTNRQASERIGKTYTDSKHAHSVNHTNHINNTLNAKVDAVKHSVTNLGRSVSNNANNLKNTRAFCCFSEHNHNTGRKMCLPAGDWDIHHMGFNDRISWISCQKGAKATLYADWFNGRSVNIGSGQTMDGHTLNRYHIQDRGSTLRIRPV